MHDNLLFSAGVLAPAIAQLAVASPAQADDPILAAGSAADAAAGSATEAAAASASSSLITLTDAAPDDPVVTVLFYVAIGILSVVTLGVSHYQLHCRPFPRIPGRTQGVEMYQ